jgi:hypothetical protein
MAWLAACMQALDMNLSASVAEEFQAKMLMAMKSSVASDALSEMLRTHVVVVYPGQVSQVHVYL